MLSIVLRQLLQTKYYSNPQKTPYHELALREIFIDNGFKEFPSSSKTFNQKEFWKTNHYHFGKSAHLYMPKNGTSGARTQTKV